MKLSLYRVFDIDPNSPSGTGVSETNHVELLSASIISQCKEGCGLNLLAAGLGGQKYTFWAKTINPVEVKPCHVTKWFADESTPRVKIIFHARKHYREAARF
jgi:hypothetical protein